MAKLSFSVGDRVEVKSWKEMVNEFGLTRYGDINLNPCFVRSMKGLCGKKAIIESTDEGIELKFDNERLTEACWDFPECSLRLVIEPAVRAKEIKSNIEKIEILRAMHLIILKMNNEDAYMRWIQCGVPDEPEEDDYIFMASDDESFKDSVEEFKELFTCYIKDGLYIGDKLYAEDKRRKNNANNNE